MSYTIKPEDIPNTFYQEFGHMFKPDLIKFLNACIEAGIVSPPCYCLRWSGELQMVDFTDNPKVFAGKPWSQDTEHYKGQTK